MNNFYLNGYTNLTGESSIETMKEVIDSTIWSNTPVGAMEHWPVSLKTMISMILSSRHPMLLWWGKDRVQFYNDSYKQILGVNGKHPAALGQKGIDCWPELWEVIEPLMQQVLEGSSTWSENELIPIYRNGQIEEVYWTFGYSSVCDETGNINGILVICTETTQKVLAEKRIARQISNLFTHAPIAICIFRGKDYEIEMANNKMLEIWGLDEKAVLNRFVFDVFPELITKGFKELLNRVFNNGERFIVPQSPITLERNGKAENIFVKFIYEPLRDEDGSVSGVMALAHDVTDLVLAIKKTEDAEEKAIMAIDSAELGVYEINLVTRELLGDERFFKILGLHKKAGLLEVISLMNPKDTLKIKAAYKAALITGKLNYEASIICEDNNIHWVKINGKLFYNEKNEAIKILGVIDDITEQKFLERQKDDFLSVASHELKTPITTIKGFGQVAEMMLEKKEIFKYLAY